MPPGKVTLDFDIEAEGSMPQRPEAKAKNDVFLCTAFQPGAN